MEGLKQLMDALTVMRTNVLNQYAKKTGHTVEEVAAWMDATSWWTAAEAKENGFIDEITESNQTAKSKTGMVRCLSTALPFRAHLMMPLNLYETARGGPCHD